MKNKKRTVYTDRLITAREAKGYTQIQFAEKVREYMGNKFSKGYLSSIESNRRPLPQNYIEPFSKILGVSEDYLCGLTSDKNGTAEDEVKPTFDWRDMTTEIEISQLGKYEGQPVCIRRKDTGMQYWGIVMKVPEDQKYSANVSGIGGVTGDRIYGVHNYGVLVGEPYVQIIAITPNVEKLISISLWARLYTEYESMYQQQMTLRQVLNSEETVFVRMRNADPQIYSMYDGWYKLNETKDFLVNEEGRMLPINGCGITYNCYSQGIDSYEDIKKKRRAEWQEKKSK